MKPKLNKYMTAMVLYTLITSNTPMTSNMLMTSSTVLAGEAPTDNTQGFSASVSSSYLYNDNVTRDSNNSVSAYVFLVRPQLGVDWDTGTTNFGITLSNETAKFEGSSEDNYSDTTLDFNADVSVSSRHALAFNAGFADTHQARGQGFTIGNGSIQDSVDDFSQSDYGVRYTYGREETPAELSVYYSAQTVDFDSILDISGQDITANRDRTNQVLGVAFAYELGPRTDLIVEINQSEQDYDLETGFGNTVDSSLIGIRWEATAKTSGRISIGTQDREQLSGDSSDATIWQIAVDWSPKTYSTVSLESGKSSEASIGIGNARDIERTRVSWSHDWSSRLNSNVSYTDEQTDFSGTSTTLDAQTFSTSVSYLFSDNISLNLFFDDSSRDSNNEFNFAFDQQTYGIQVLIEFL